MELFFPLIGVFAVIVATVAATGCILVPGPKHLVRRVFFGTVGFIFGGAVCTAIVTVILAVTIENVLPSVHRGETLFAAFASLAFIILGAASCWTTIKFVDSLFDSLSYREARPSGSAPQTPESISPIQDADQDQPINAD